MASPLEPMFRSYVYPVMRELGFSRKGGRLFYRLAESGDLASIFIHSFRLTGVESFQVDYGIVTAAQQAWKVELGIKDPLSPAQGIIWTRLEMPRDVLMSQFSDSMEWGFYSGDEESMLRCGEALARALKEEVGPFLLRMLDKAELSRFIDELPESELDRWTLPRDRSRAQTELWLDDWPVAELQPRLVAAYGGDKPNRRLRWAQERLAARAAREAHG